jgi:hypothetical protein
VFLATFFRTLDDSILIPLTFRAFMYKPDDQNAPSCPEYVDILPLVQMHTQHDTCFSFHVIGRKHELERSVHEASWLSHIVTSPDQISWLSGLREGNIEELRVYPRTEVSITSKMHIHKIMSAHGLQNDWENREKEVRIDAEGGRTEVELAHQLGAVSIYIGRKLDVKMQAVDLTEASCQ